MSEPKLTTTPSMDVSPDIAEQRQRCKCCGAPLEGSVPAQPEKPKDERDREKML
jgi:hypothetical protein